jgi:hypothetical protein
MAAEAKKKQGKDNDVEEHRFQFTSAMISRKERELGSDDEYMIGVIKLFEVNNPHKTMCLPKKTLEFRNIEKIRIRNLAVSYYLEGNDIIINDIIEIYIKVEHKKHKITLRCFQKAVEERDVETLKNMTSRTC